MQTQKTNSFVPFSTSILRLFIIAVFAAFFIALATPVQAAWNVPSCNPDDVGPDDPTCNIAAPINTSTAHQLKLGEFTIQNVLRAGDLVVNSGLGGDGTVDITTSKGTAVIVRQNDGLSRAVDIETNSTKAGLRVTQNGSRGRRRTY